MWTPRSSATSPPSLPADARDAVDPVRLGPHRRARSDAARHRRGHRGRRALRPGLRGGPGPAVAARADPSRRRRHAGRVVRPAGGTDRSLPARSRSARARGARAQAGRRHHPGAAHRGLRRRGEPRAGRDPRAAVRAHAPGLSTATVHRRRRLRDRAAQVLHQLGVAVRAAAHAVRRAPRRGPRRAAVRHGRGRRHAARSAPTHRRRRVDRRGRRGGRGRPGRPRAPRPRLARPRLQRDRDRRRAHGVGRAHARGRSAHGPRQPWLQPPVSAHHR